MKFIMGYSDFWYSLSGTSYIKSKKDSCNKWKKHGNQVYTIVILLIVFSLLGFFQPFKWSFNLACLAPWSFFLSRSLEFRLLTETCPHRRICSVSWTCQSALRSPALSHKQWGLCPAPHISRVSASSNLRHFLALTHKVLLSVSIINDQ